eukprot:4561078-Prymnesium_polylepis.1
MDTLDYIVTNAKWSLPDDSYVQAFRPESLACIARSGTSASTLTPRWTWRRLALSSWPASASPASRGPSALSTPSRRPSGTWSPAPAT